MIQDVRVAQNLRLIAERGIKRASELYGLTFDNKLDSLLGTGLKSKTLTYLYGKRVVGVVNLFALNSIRQFGGRAFFVDAGNAADPYLIRRESDLRRKDSTATSKLLKSIGLVRVFTCHQLTNFITDQLPAMLSEKSRTDEPIKFVGVSGLDQVFSEEDSPKTEIENLQRLIARKLHEIVVDKTNGVMFVVATSQNECLSMLDQSDVAISVYQDARSRDHAALIRHPSMRGKDVEF